MAKASVNIAVVGQYSGKALERASRDMKNLQLSAAAELGGVSASLITGGAEWITYGTKIEGIGKKIEGVGKTASTYLTLPIIGAGVAVGKAAIDIDTSLTGVRKTVDATESEYQAMKDAAVAFSETNFVTASQVLQAEELGGQLGIAKENLQEFARITTGLDISTNMDVETASTNLARYANIVKMSSEDYERYGNVIVGLGNNMATTESEISDFSLRMASAGSQAGMSSSDILGISAALSSLGLEAEAGGSAFSKTLTEMSVQVSTGGEQLETFAKISGKTVDEFANKFKTDATGAFVDFIAGLSNGQAAGEDMNVMLQDLGINEIRQSDALRRLGGNTEILTDAIKLANQEWESGTALQDEVDNKNASMEAQLGMLKNQVVGVAEQFGGPLINSLMDVVEVSKPFFDAIKTGAEAFSNMDESQQHAIVSAVGFVAAFGPVTTMIGKATTLYGKGVKGIGQFNQQLGLMSAAAKGGKGDMTGLGASIGGIASKTKVTSVAVQGASKAIGALSKVAITGGGILAGAMAAGFVLSAVSAIQSADATKKANEAFDKTLSNTESFGTLVEKTAPQVGDFASMISASGKSVAELDQTIADSEAGITAVIATAFSEQRALRDEDVASINAYNEQIRTALQEKTNTYIAGLEGQYSAITTTEGDLSAEQAAQRISNINAISSEALAALEEGNNKEVALIQQKHEAAGTVDSEGYAAEIKAQQDFYQQQLDAINSGGNKAKTAVIDKQKSINASTVREFSELSTQVDEWYKSTHQTGIEALDTLFVATSEFTGGMNDAKNAYKESLAGIDAAQTSTFFGMIATTKSSGGQLSEENRNIANTILGAYDDLPDSMDETGKSSLLSFMTGMEEQLTGVSDLSGYTADQIVEMMRSHLNLGELSAEKMTEFANGLHSAGGPEGSVTSAASGVANAALTAFNNASGGMFLSGEHAGMNFGSGLMSERARGAVLSGVSTLAQIVANNIKHTKPKEGPLAEGEELWGLHAGQNFASGLVKSKSDVNKASTSIAGATAAGFVSPQISTSTQLGSAFSAPLTQSSIGRASAESNALKLDRIIALLEDFGLTLTEKVSSAIPNSWLVNDKELFRLGKKAGL